MPSPPRPLGSSRSKGQSGEDAYDAEDILLGVRAAHIELWRELWDRAQGNPSARREIEAARKEVAKLKAELLKLRKENHRVRDENAVLRRQVSTLAQAS